MLRGHCFWFYVCSCPFICSFVFVSFSCQWQQGEEEREGSGGKRLRRWWRLRRCFGISAASCVEEVWWPQLLPLRFNTGPSFHLSRTPSLSLFPSFSDFLPLVLYSAQSISSHRLLFPAMSHVLSLLPAVHESSHFSHRDNRPPQPRNCPSQAVIGSSPEPSSVEKLCLKLLMVKLVDILCSQQQI